MGTVDATTAALRSPRNAVSPRAIRYWAARALLGWLALGLVIYTLYGFRHSRLVQHVSAFPARFTLIVPGTLTGAALAWWFLRDQHPWNLAVPIALLFALALYAFSVTERRAA